MSARCSTAWRRGRMRSWSGRSPGAPSARAAATSRAWSGSGRRWSRRSGPAGPRRGDAAAASAEVDAEGAPQVQPHPTPSASPSGPRRPCRWRSPGHYDTVYPGGDALPEVVTRGDGALHGPGIADMKGGLSVMLAALEALEAHPAAANWATGAAVARTRRSALRPRRGSWPIWRAGRTWGSPTSRRSGTGRWPPRARVRATSRWRCRAGRPTPAGTSRRAATPSPAAARLAAALDGLNGRREASP
jgi:glutamate carboxypeptidase